jgi:hypothetical protein
MKHAEEVLAHAEEVHSCRKASNETAKFNQLHRSGCRMPACLC